jgi:hypothetical protein
MRARKAGFVDTNNDEALGSGASIVLDLTSPILLTTLVYSTRSRTFASICSSVASGNGSFSVGSIASGNARSVVA